MYYTIRWNIPVGNNVGSIQGICGTSLDIKLWCRMDRIKFDVLKTYLESLSLSQNLIWGCLFHFQLVNGLSKNISIEVVVFKIQIRFDTIAFFAMKCWCRMDMSDGQYVSHLIWPQLTT